MGEQVGKEIFGAASFEAAAPVGWRAEFLASVVLSATQRIVGSTLFGIAQHAISFVQLFGARVGIRFLADVRMIFADQLAISFLDLVFAGSLGDSNVT